MILTDREWLRFVSFALVAGGLFGALTSGALLLEGVPPLYALVGTVVWFGAFGAIFHLMSRRLLDRALEPVPEDPDPEGETA